MVDPTPYSVQIVAYDPAWPEIAARESARVQAAIGGTLITVEHIGSTAVPGLAAKPVLDLMLIVSELMALDHRRPQVEAIGYAWHGEYDIAGRRFCTLTKDGSRRVHVHCFAAGSPEIHRHLAFRDYMRAHPDRARAYADEKRRAAALHPDNSTAYNREKWAWVEQEEARALEWAAATGAEVA